MEEVKTLEDFYRTMMRLRDTRRRIVSEYLKNGSAGKSDIGLLEDYLRHIEAIPRENDAYALDAGDGHRTLVDLGYETGELRKDVFFLTHTEEQFIIYLAEDVFAGGRHEYMRQLESGKRFLSGWNIRNFLTDRDGTVNNYCGRYRSSIQAVYNAVFLTRFAENRPENSVVLTSAPLSGGGLLDVSVSPGRCFSLRGFQGQRVPFAKRQGRQVSDL